MGSSAINLKGAQGNDALRNLINNAAFNEWNNGATFEITTPDGKVALKNCPDGWFTRYYSGNGETGDVFKVDKRPHTLGQTDVEGNPLYFTRFQNGKITAGTGGDEVISFSQRIPNVISLQNESVALSFYAKGYTSGQKLGVSFTQFFGLSGDTADEFGLGRTASDPVYVQGKEVGLTGDWRKYNLRFNIPSISGKEIGVHGKNFTELNFFVQAGDTAATARNLINPVSYTGDTLDFANVQLERGVDFSSFENIQQNQAFKEMIGAHITGIASGQITRGYKDTSSMFTTAPTLISDATVFNAPTDGFFIDLNDVSGASGNNCLKYGRFYHRSDTAGPPIFIVSPSITNDNTTDMRQIKCFAETVAEDERILKIVAFDQNGSTVKNLEAVNLFAIQLNIAGPGTFGGGGNDAGGGGGPKDEDPDFEIDDGVDVFPGSSGRPCEDTSPDCTFLCTECDP